MRAGVVWRRADTVFVVVCGAGHPPVQRAGADSNAGNRFGAAAACTHEAGRDRSDRPGIVRLRVQGSSAAGCVLSLLVRLAPAADRGSKHVSLAGYLAAGARPQM